MWTLYTESVNYYKSSHKIFLLDFKNSKIYENMNFQSHQISSSITSAALKIFGWNFGQTLVTIRSLDGLRLGGIP